MRFENVLAFLQIRDGSGLVQTVISRADVSEEAWEDVVNVTQESTVRVTGIARIDERAPGGVEIQATDFVVNQQAVDFPITNKEHGTAFLMEHRHLWLRSSRQRATLRIRSEVCQAIRDFFYDREFTLIDSPILTANAAEGTSTLFETDYFGDKAYLSQSGQLYLEPAAAAFGKVYCFGPTFRAEKSKTRRHLMEFWMVEPEVAFLEFDGLQALAEEFVEYVVGRVVDKHQEPLKQLERDLTKLEHVQRALESLRLRVAGCLVRLSLLRIDGGSLLVGAKIAGHDLRSKRAEGVAVLLRLLVRLRPLPGLLATQERAEVIPLRH